MKSYRIGKTLRESRLPVAFEGLPFILVGGIITALFFYGGLLFAAIPMGIMSLFTLFFFRDPERRIGTQANAVLTPADGKILNISHLKDSNNPLGEPGVKVSIFMSIFNVHVNRVPIGGRVSEIVYTPGQFFSANLDKASEKNENNRIILETDRGRKIVFVQIAGLIARRIVCWINEQDYVKAGQKCGLIRFGSRVDIYIPDDSRIIIQPREKVKAGETIIGYLS